ncbi:MAG TPA: FHA domain-containing protein, partial [Bdellovibrionota bacterium]|nr:FHA domain-containing protein [Bdellovibrionota bacterium]
PSEEGVTVESVEGSTFHFAGGDINSGLLSPGESMQVGPFTIKCEIADHHAFHEEEGEEDSEEPDFLEEFASKEDHWEDQELFNPSGENKSQFHTIKADLLEEGSFEIPEEPSEQSRQFGVEETTEVHEYPLLPKLVLLSGNAAKENYALVGEDSFIIGRSEDADVFIDDVKVSRHHAELVFENDQFYIKDLESANGTLVNGQAISLQVLNSYDVIEIGGTKLQFLLVDEGTYDSAQHLVQQSLPAQVTSQGGIIPQDGILAPYYIQPPQNRSFIKKFAVYIFVGMAGYLVYQQLHQQKGTPTQVASGELARAPSAVVPEDQRAQIEAIYQRAIDFYKNREYKKALEEANKVLAIVPEHPMAQKLAQNASLALENIDKAREVQQLRVEDEMIQDQLSFYQSIGLDYLNREQYEKAEESFLKVLELDPGNSEGKRLLDLARAHLPASENREIASVPATKASTDQAEELMQQGHKLYQEGKLREAIEAWNGVLRLEGENMLSYYAKAERAIDEAERSIEREYAPLISQARAYFQAGDYENARRTAEALLAKDPQHAEAQELIAEVSFHLHEKAKALFTEAVIDESLGYLDAAKQRFEQILQTVTIDDEYFAKAQIHLRKYPKELASN